MATEFEVDVITKLAALIQWTKDHDSLHKVIINSVIRDVKANGRKLYWIAGIFAGLGLAGVIIKWP